MTTALDSFFGAWSRTDAAGRRALVDAALAPGATYSDPRTGGRLTGSDAVADHVGGFSAGAPGWGAAVVRSDGVNGYLRALVAFRGPGPDGAEVTRHGTYFADLDGDGRIRGLAGFVGETIG